MSCYTLKNTTRDNNPTLFLTAEHGSWHSIKNFRQLTWKFVCLPLKNLSGCSTLLCTCCYFCFKQWFSQSVVLQHSISITWKLVRRANIWAPSQTLRITNSGPTFCVLTSLPCDSDAQIKSENHWLKTTFPLFPIWLTSTHPDEVPSPIPPWGSLPHCPNSATPRSKLAESLCFHTICVSLY